MKAVFFGTPAFAATVLECLVASDVEIAGVVTQPARPTGRGRHVEPSPVQTTATEHGLPVEAPAQATQILSQLGTWQPDVLIVAAYGQIFPPTLLWAAPHGALNVHASLLPAYRGASPIQHAILDALTETGVTIMQMDENLDTGPTLASQTVSINALDTTETLSEKLAKAGGNLLVATLPKYVAGRLQPQPQRGVSSLTTLIKKDDGRIDWNQPAEYLERFVRAMQPWPSAWTEWNGQRVKILAATPINRQLTPGAISTDEQVVVGTGQGALQINELQIAGGQPMSGAAALAGYGDRLDRFS